MARHQGRDAGYQGGLIQGTVELHGGGDGIGSAVWLQLIEKPQPLLRKAQRKDKIEELPPACVWLLVC